MESSLIAVLINVTGIQDYIFSSNKLKENIGASSIIEREIYDSLMDQMLKVNYKDKYINEWKDDPTVKIIIDDNIECEVGYIGGGNTLMLFKHDKEASNFIKEFSRAILISYPGLRLAFGLMPDFNVEKYDEYFPKLVEDLQQNKSRHIPVNSVPKHGITADCPWSNDSAEVFDEVSMEYISMGSYSKIESEEEVEKNLRRVYAIEDKYTFTNDIEKLGQEKESSYIAVVHVDGNGMGKIFAKIDKLTDLRRKSNEVSLKANSAMKLLLAKIAKLIKGKEIKDGSRTKIEYYIGDVQLRIEDKDKDNKGKIILPIRPILVGGDDITFICEGRLGIYLAERFINHFYDGKERAKTDEKEILMSGACAGVAIVKTHFPFYKAVQLAGELCDEAKKPAKKAGKGCYISYYYSATTFSGSLEQLRQRTHLASTGSMYYGPYLLLQDSTMEKLKNGIKYFKENWPKNKVMALREVIAENTIAQELFENEIAVAGLSLPESTDNKIWTGRTTPYFDQIELMDFYPDNLLTQNNDEDNS